MDKEKILQDAKEEADRWLSIIKHDGKADLKKIKKELEKIRHKGKAPYVVVTDDINDAPKVLLEAAKELYGKDAKKKLKELSPHLCIWDYYLMAFWESAYHRLPEKNIEFMNHSLFEACKAGLGFIVNLGDLIVGVTRPESYRTTIERNGRTTYVRHREDGPATISRTFKDYFWQGVRVPEKWIMDKENLTKEDFKAIQNQEQKRAFCEILGWERLLDMLGAKKIQSDDWGDLVETQLDDDDGNPARFADVRCPSTGRRYLIRTDPSTKTCKEALARSANVEMDDYIFEAES